jgi:hypothetical protein
VVVVVVVVVVVEAGGGAHALARASVVVDGWASSRQVGSAHTKTDSGGRSEGVVVSSPVVYGDGDDDDDVCVAEIAMQCRWALECRQEGGRVSAAAGGLLEDCWRTAGGLLEDCWSNSGRVQIGVGSKIEKRQGSE